MVLLLCKVQHPGNHRPQSLVKGKAGLIRVAFKPSRTKARGSPPPKLLTIQTKVKKTRMVAGTCFSTLVSLHRSSLQSTSTAGDEKQVGATPPHSPSHAVKPTRQS